RQEHYAARSALQMGMLYEKSGNTNEAVKCYNECLSMRNHDFQANIDQQAKAGINRLTAK
ncbi:MAG TPA: tetratricopeptide repeat protein, partial [Flavipsychrobacter sp.]|nr:tetratricopeptide repeat protein [Flavipsychrobacter sp.]